MKIAICGSMAFGKEILDLRSKLESRGHEIVVPDNIDKYASGEIGSEDKWDKVESDVIKSYYEKIMEQDAILVFNEDKNEIENYVGGNSLIEMAFAHVLGKKIFLWKPVPEMSYSDEIEAMSPVVLNEILEKIG